ncbi:MAG: metal-dependent transcriptional regulator [Rhodothermales bacterium]|nr:metal-dependent transcriptional regulator [Rhodothermales bacterium]
MPSHTQAVEDYLKTIYDLLRQGEAATTSARAERLGVTPASVTGMAKKLAGLNLVAHEPYRGVVLTEAGRKIALEVIRHHRLVELYLHEALGVPWDQVHAEAEKIEHVLSEELEARLDAALGHPTVDPHGAPIPSVDLELEEPERTPLAELEPGQRAVVAEVSDHDAELLRYLGGLGLYPQTPLEVVALAPFEGPLTVRVGGAEQTVGRRAAAYIFVTDIRDA